MGSGIVRQTGEVDRLTKVKPFPPNDWLERTASSMGNCGGVGGTRKGKGHPFETSHGKCGISSSRHSSRVELGVQSHRSDTQRQRQVVSYMVQSPDPIAQRSLRVRFSEIVGCLGSATSVFFCCIPTVCVYVLYMLPSRRESRT